MANLGLHDIIEALPGLELPELETLETTVQAFRKLLSSNTLMTDSPLGEDTEEDGLGLDAQAEKILKDKSTYDLTLAEQALLAALSLSEVYQLDSFTNRDINKFIKDSGRAQVINITTATAGLISRNYLVKEDKEMSLTAKGRSKARMLMGSLRRKAKEAGSENDLEIRGEEQAA